ncbi:hypothetical protein P9112_005213 [Eukaryota sp. TZLM1-RC]
MAIFQYPSSTFAEKLFHTTDFFDVNLVYLEHELALHRHVLSVFSRYLHQMFTITTTDRDLQRIEIDNLPIDVTIFQDFINSLYCQPLEITNQNVFDLYYIAEYFKAAEIVATFSLNRRSSIRPIPSGTVFGIWAYYKGSEYSIVDY